MNIHGFFLAYFGLMAGSIAHQFISAEDSLPEFLAKCAAGGLGAWIGPTVLGHRGVAEEGVWFLPEFAGALIVAFAIAYLWKARATAHVRGHRKAGRTTCREAIYTTSLARLRQDERARLAKC